MIRLFLIQAAALVLVMSLAWWWQRRCGNAGWVDVFWTFGTGIAGILGALWPFADNAVYGPRQFCVAVLAAIWAGRLGCVVPFSAFYFRFATKLFGSRTAGLAP